MRESATVILNGSGNGTAKIGPLSAREVWHPDNVHVSANAQPTNDAQCQIFTGSDTSAVNFRDATFTGSSGDSSDKVNSTVIHCGQYIWAVWTGGDANVTATLTVTGQKEL